MLRRTAVTRMLAAHICLLVGGTNAVADDPAVSVSQESPQPTRSMELLSECSLATGEKYLAARDALLRMDDPVFLRLLKRLATDDNTTCPECLTASIILARRESPGEWGVFGADFSATIQRSHETVTGRPSIRAISGFCHRFARKHEAASVELMMLEQLVHSDLPAHVRCGIARALGAIGGAQSAGPLMQIVRSTSDESLLRYAALSLADVAKRHRTSGVGELLRETYHTRARIRGGADEVSRAVLAASCPQASLIVALQHLGGEEGIAALTTLAGEEKDEALKRLIEEALSNLRKAEVRAESQKEGPGSGARP